MISAPAPAEPRFDGNGGEVVHARFKDFPLTAIFQDRHTRLGSAAVRPTIFECVSFRTAWPKRGRRARSNTPRRFRTTCLLNNQLVRSNVLVACRSIDFSRRAQITLSSINYVFVSPPLLSIIIEGTEFVIWWLLIRRSFLSPSQIPNDERFHLNHYDIDFTNRSIDSCT